MDMGFGEEYFNNYAHFIAGGRTLEIIKQYEADCENPEAALQKLAAEYGAKDVWGGGDTFVFAQKTTHPAFGEEEESRDPEGNLRYLYRIDHTTQEGRALQDRLDDIPSRLGFGTFSIFARRLTGEKEIATNPDFLRHPRDTSYGNSGDFREGATTTAATYRKYGDTYIVSVPRTVRGVFNEASAKESEEEGYPVAAGYKYEWFMPPDSTPVPYSKVVELREKELGDQLAPRRVPGSVTAFPSRKPANFQR
ncbi:MAG: hypothetical protein EA357_01675 [Micavibrio sp.]|nr:MAG: hypothetical protein EA357_01675 [Micavibrio sp.]